MTNEQILKKAIKKANENGWGKDVRPCDYMARDWDIFDHDFAKAFWGEEKNTKYVNPEGNEYIYVEYWWQYHLQQMVISKEPLEYIEKFLKK